MNQPATSVPSGENPGPKDIGAQMAALREQFNLSQQEVSERLHIRARYVSAIEEGRYELMPGKVYARGYVHTYAEFLGLNPEEVVAKCFVGELPANAQPIPPIAAARHSPPSARRSLSSGSSSRWRGYAVLGALVLGASLIVSQFVGHGSGTEKQEVTAVTPVPEAMLASMRTMVMPLPQNYECLTTDAVLACLNADAATRLLSHLATDNFRYIGGIDLNALVATPIAEIVETPRTESNEENPDSPAVATVPVTAVAPQATDDVASEPGPPHD